MKKIVLFALGMAMSMTTFAQDEVETTISADVVSSYIWRGQDLGSTALQPTLGIVYKGLFQEATSLLPDYAFKGSESAAGTSFSGIVGALVVVLITVGACYAFKFFPVLRPLKTPLTI